ncbi:SAM-dependent methyltransferase [Nonomuraea ferruginea]|uniref:S-adenosyl-L-methionine-dependent methyltransferase n=1 Tax=Nonomuraea ferruginea TaxID=46174 RepID=A0ABT4SZF0_9ACTN|nr:SAM-dependent methyltransferase [Nonomuraea ferruginea]MDA0642539.1 SAM-dependent methyltransferase [Nonomuraea ferruginea]
MTRRPAAAQTALGPMVIAAVEQYEPPGRRLIEDGLAAGLLPVAARAAVRACRWKAVRAWMAGASDRRAPGVWGGVLCRKRYADDKVAEAFGAGIEQLVVLGAGLDTRACRLTPPGGRAYELDLPVNVAGKRQGLRALPGGVPERVRLIEVDFETAELADVLTTALAVHGFEADRPAVFVWEAVTQYLSDEAVHAALAFLSRAAPGSRLLFTYVLADFLHSGGHGAAALHEEFVTKRRVWRFGLAPDEVGALLGRYGWIEREQVGSAEYRHRYLAPAGELAGRELTVSDLERFVEAVKP